MTNYPSVVGFWYDGTWDQSIVKNGKLTYDLEETMQKINPQIISGSRLRCDELGKRHFDANGEMMGDYEQGWERRLPNKVMKNDWECVMTVPENQWGYHSDWQGHVKTPYEVIEMVVGSASWSGNFMINFGPGGDGSIRPEEMNISKEVGAWMQKNGEVVYGCESAGLPEQKWGYYTMNAKTGKVYMTVFNTPLNKILRVKLDAKTKMNKANLLVGGKALRIEEGGPSEYLVHLDKFKPSKAPFVIEINLTQGEGEAVKSYVAPKI